MEKLEAEFEKLKSKRFSLSFVYPGAEQRERLRIVHRDMTDQEQRRLQSRQQNLHDLVSDLKSGDLLLKDLDENEMTVIR